MRTIIEAHVVRVFVDSNGNFGSPVGIVIDEARTTNSDERLSIARQLGFSETVFINNLMLPDVNVFALEREILFAGAPLVGAAWFIEKQTGQQVRAITVQGNDIEVVHDEGLVWVASSSLSILPAWTLEELSNAAVVEKVNAADRPAGDHAYTWAWMDKSLAVGRIRARTFAPAWGIAEEEANGSGSMLLAHRLGRSLLIKHGLGSYIRATAGANRVAVGGLVKEDTSIHI